MLRLAYRVKGCWVYPIPGCDIDSIVADSDGTALIEDEREKVMTARNQEKLNQELMRLSER